MAEPAAKRQKSDDSAKITVMMNGLPGAMGHEVAACCLRRGFDLADAALTGPGMPGDCEVEAEKGGAKHKVKLVGSGEAGAQRAVLDEAVKKYGDGLVIIDFTHPSAVNPNADLYNAAGCAFVMGTTGGDREALMEGTKTSGNYAVIAANMGKQIVALQATMSRMAKDFPGAFSGYTLDIAESHQKTKADTSGTAKDMVASFQGLGVDYNVEDIVKVRGDDASVKFGVPEEHLNGHAFHTYTLQSADSTVEFQIKHNVCGRLVYAEGVTDAVQFLAAKKIAKSEKKLFNMIDILEAGEMR